MHNTFLRQRRLALWLLPIWLLALSIRADTPYDLISLSESPTEVNIAPYLWWTEDKDAKLQLEDIVYQRVSPTWRKNGEDYPNFGLGQNPFWFKLRVTNLGFTEVERWLEVQNPVLDQIEVYLLSDGYVIESYTTGDTYPFSHRPVAHRNFLFPLKFAAGQTYTIYIRAFSLGSLQLPASLWDPTAFIDQDQWFLAAQLLFTGIMLAMAGYNLILWLLIRDTTYFFYVVTVVAVAIVQLSLHGVSYQFFWPDAPKWNQIQIIFFIGVSMTFACLFSYRFLDLHNRQVLIQRLYRFVSSLGIITIILAFTAPYAFGLKVALLIVTLLSILFLGSGFFLWLRKTPNAGIFTIGWVIFLIGNISIATAKIGIIPSVAIIEYAPQIGSSIEVFLFSLALAQRINQERRKRLVMQEHALLMERQARESQQEMLKAQQLANSDLEQRVALRTEELRAALSNLSRLNAQIQELAIRDELTHLYSVDQFMVHLEEEWSRCSRSVSPLSVVIIRVDNYRMIAKRYGQQAADTYLVELGKKLEGMTERAGDRAYRLTDDEFALILPHSAIENALHAAEQLRSFSEAKLIVYGEHRYTATLSIGICNEIPDGSNQFEGMIERSRSAMEKALSQGGNSVQFSLEY